jgi:molybdopterin synthase catalytic subunit/molybdopterin converting factor small subunit
MTAPEIEVRVRFFAQLRELAVARDVLGLGADSTVADAWEEALRRWPALGEHRPWVRAARNGAYAEWTAPLAEGDEVAFLPPVSGGAPVAALTGEPIDVAALEGRLAGTAHGAIVTFVGRARDHADDGRIVLELDYEAYEPMAVAVLEEIGSEVEQRWPGVAVGVIHRIGPVPIGDAAVAIVTASPHRSAAYEANRHVIEEIKRRLPIWKRERFADGSEWKRPGA